MKSPTEFPWHTMGPKMRQFLEERLRDTPPFLHTRVSILAAVGMGWGASASRWSCGGSPPRHGSQPHP